MWTVGRLEFAFEIHPKLTQHKQFRRSSAGNENAQSLTYETEGYKFEPCRVYLEPQ